MRLTLVSAFGVFLATAQSANILLTIPPSPLLASPSTLPASTTATLTTLAKTYTVSLSTANSFSFRDVAPGSYLLDVHCVTHVFAPLRIDVVRAAATAEGVSGKEIVEAWGTFRGNEWDNRGEVVVVTTQGAKSTLEVKAIREKGYYVERTGFSPLSILKNPMMLIAGASMLIVFGMPYLMDNMDPEVRAEFEERQKSSPVAGLLAGPNPGANNPLANFDAASWLAGSGKKDGSGGTAEGSVEKGVSR